MAQTFTVSRTADKWYVSFAIKAEKIPPLFHPVVETVGIDLGVSTFATLSDGNYYESPRPLTKAKIKLSKAQWRNRNKQLGNKRLGVIVELPKFMGRLPINVETSCRKLPQKSVENMLIFASKICSYLHRRFERERHDC
jgi:hypothetical protein